jgi:broad-specificity NMP kinase
VNQKIKERNKFHFIGQLEKKIEQILNTKNKVLISVVGEGGIGKSFFGKYLRNHGCGKFNKRDIAVIDDGVMWIEFLYFFRRTMKSKNNEFDELKPFLKKLPKRKKIIFYINATPWERISKADILLILSTDENTREKRLKKRYKDQETIDKFINADTVTDYRIKYTFLLHGRI